MIASAGLLSRLVHTDTYHGPASVRTYHLDHFVDDRDIEKAGQTLGSLIYDLYDPSFDEHAVVETLRFQEKGKLPLKAQTITHILGDGIRVRTRVDSNPYDTLTYVLAIQEGHGTLQKQQWISVSFRERTIEGARWYAKSGNEVRFEVCTGQEILLTTEQSTGSAQFAFYELSQGKSMFDTLASLARFQQAKCYQLSRKK